MRKYVVGFLFWRGWVLLVKKNKPEWQKGFLNGIGGKMEEHDEDAHAAMVREWKEEVGIPVPEPRDWRQFAVESGLDDDRIKWTVYFFMNDCSSIDERPKVPGGNDIGEMIGWIPVECVGEKFPAIANLAWLIPLALDKRAVFAQVEA